MAMARWVLPHPASSVEHEVLGSVDELEGDELFASPVGGERGHAPVVPVKFFGLGEAGLSEQPVPFGFGAAGVLGGEQGREEAELAGVAFSTARLSTLRVNGRLRESSMTCSAVAFRAVRSVRFAGSVVISFLHVGVVSAQIGAGCGVLAALPDPSGGLVDRGAVEAGVRHR